MDQHTRNLDAVEALVASGRLDQARAVLQRLLRTHPSDHRTLWLAAVLHSALNQPDRAAHYAERATIALPNHAPTLVGLANALFNLGRGREARDALTRALAADPTSAEAHEALAELEFQNGNVREAERLCRAGLLHTPGAQGLRAMLAAALVHLGDVAEARTLLLDPDHRAALPIECASTLCQTCHYLPDITIAQTLAAAAQFQRMLDTLLPGPHSCPLIDARPERRLRLGVLSGELRAHSVAFFLEPLLERLDRGPSGFDIVLYNVSGTADAVTARFKNLASNWRDVPHLDAPALCAAIRADRIDILLETSGHTDAMRLPALHLRAAPLQVSFCGYPGTTGVRAIDARIVDALTDPPGGSDHHATERLLRLDPCFLCYRPPADAPDPAKLTGRPFTFGSFNTLQKVNPPLLDAWSRLLHAVPDSRLMLKSGALTGTDLRERTIARLISADINPDRCDLLGATPTTAEHLATYQRVDLALDTFPYAGTTTTCEALLMQTPVVTLAGDRHAQRVGVSLLSALGLSELIAPTVEQYIATAAALAQDHTRRLSLGHTLRERLRRSPLCDEPAYAASFSALLRQLWRDRCTAKSG